MFHLAQSNLRDQFGPDGRARRLWMARRAKFMRDRKGSAGIVFGLMAFMLFLFVAGAVDFSRWLSARTDTLAAVDAAVLAGARSLQVKSDDAAAAIAAANHYYKENTRNLTGIEDQIEFVTARNNTAVQAKGSAYIQTPFLAVAGIPRMLLVKGSDSEFSEAVVAVGGNSETNFEIAMMLDVTGSMQGQKLEDLKVAAKDLIDIVVWADQGSFTSRVALVPFAEAINIDDSNWAAEVVENGPQNFRFRDWSGDRREWKLDPKCATERIGLNAFTDATPNGGMNMVGKFYDSDGKCMPKSGTVIPLSSNKEMLKGEIDDYQASGATAGHLGTAWAWYMLSPEWEQRVPPASRPAPYSMLTELNSRGQPKLRKIAILMTDGEYNTQYCLGVRDTTINCLSPNGTSNAQARTLCTNMKAKGITVYTVGFQMPTAGESVTTLRQCATDPSKFFNADNGDALKQAFRDIALQISSLYLSK